LHIAQEQDAKQGDQADEAHHLKGVDIGQRRCLLLEHIVNDLVGGLLHRTGAPTWGASSEIAEEIVKTGCTPVCSGLGHRSFATVTPVRIERETDCPRVSASFCRRHFGSVLREQG
jgi:hypothetical protein